MKRLLLPVLVAFSSLLTVSAAAKLNVLMIAIDDLRPSIGCYGDPNAKTPRMDALAARGLRFERAYCQQALCSPSRISLLSGRRPSTSKIYTIGPTLRSAMPDITTLPQHFKNEGYFTRSLGKVYHVGIDDPASWSVPSWQSPKPRNGAEDQRLMAERRKAYAAKQAEPPPKGEGSIGYAVPAFEAPDVGDEDLKDGDCAREGIAALRGFAQKPGQPFFLAVGFANPHVPWVAPKKYWSLYDPAKLVMADNQFLPRSAPAFAAKSGDDFYWYSNVPKDRKITEAFGRQCLHGYLAATSYIDAQVGRLSEQMALPGSVTNPQLVGARFLLKPGRKYQEAVDLFTPYNRVQEPNPEARAAGAKLIADGAAAGPARKTLIYVNNRLEGNALETISAMVEEAEV